MEVQIKSAIEDFNKGTAVAKARAIMTLKNLVTEIPTEISACKAISCDIEALKDWS